MSQTQNRPGLDILEVLAAWKSILTGSAPMMSIEVTRECPLSCPGCYAYGEMHLGGSVNLRSLSDYRGNELVDGIVRPVRQHRPLHVSLVGGEPLVRHRELSCVLPILSSMKIHTMVVTSAAQTSDLRPHPEEHRRVSGKHAWDDHPPHAGAPGIH